MRTASPNCASQVDRITSRQLLDQEQFEQKLSALMQRQATLEQRTSALSAAISTTGSIKPARIAPPAEAPANSRSRPRRSATRSFSSRRPTARRGCNRATCRRRDAPCRAAAMPAASTAFSARVALSLDKVEHRQTAALTDLEEHVDTKARRIRSVLTDLGVDTAQDAGDTPASAGRSCRSRRRARAPALSSASSTASMSRARRSTNITHTLIAVPVRKPVDRRSRHEFAVRHAHGSVHEGARDPHRHRLARRHRRSGARHRQRHGDHRRLEGGYGNMVEVDHGNGLPPATAICRRST